MKIELPSYQVVEIGGDKLRTFRCDVHDATLTDRGCGQRWKAAQKARGIAVLAIAAADHYHHTQEEVRAHEHGRWQAESRRKLAMASNRREAVSGHAESMDACARCPLGALHAHCQPVTHSPHFASDQCPRCGFGTTRMIAGRVCVNCYNRERELLTGRNGRGNKPKRIAPLHAFGLRLVVDNGRPVDLADTGVSAVEVMCRQLRTTKGAVAFAPRRRDLVAQLRLFG